MININQLQTQLTDLAKGNQEYAKFNRQIVNTSKTVLGVRMPAMRQLAKQLAKTASYQDISQYLQELDPTVYEQTLLIGLLINYAQLTDAEKIDLAKAYLQLVDNWAEVDIFASKRQQLEPELWWNFAGDCLKSSHEFTVRYGVVEMMANFLTPKQIKPVLTRLRQVKHDGYYVKMGMAWLYATAAVKFYDLIISELTTAPLDPWTKNKALQKMVESYQFSSEQKIAIRQLRQQLRSGN